MSNTLILRVFSNFRREVDENCVLLSVTPRVAVLYCRRFGTTYWFHLQGSRIDSWSVGNYRYSLRQSTEERRCHADCCYSPVRHFAVNLTDVKLLACWHHMAGVNNKFVQHFCPRRRNKLKLGFITVKHITFIDQLHLCQLLKTCHTPRR